MVHRWEQEDELQNDLCCEEHEDSKVSKLGMVFSIRIQLSQLAWSIGSVNIGADEGNLLPWVGKGLLYMCQSWYGR